MSDNSYLYEKAFELSLNWDSTEEIVFGVVDMVVEDKNGKLAEKHAEVKRLKAKLVKQRRVKAKVS